MHGTIATAARFYLTGIVWFAVLVGTAIGYIGLIDVAFAALGVNALLTGMFTLAVAAATATAMAWIVWITMGREEARAVRNPAVERRASGRRALLTNRSSGR